METFNDNLSPEELKMLTLQFMGQNMGELKEMDKNIVTRTNTLRGMELDPHAVLNSLPATAQLQQPIQQAQPILTQQFTQPVPQIQAAVQAPAVQLTTLKNTDQLEFEFNNSPYTRQVFDRLELIEKKITNHAETMAEILVFLKSRKKPNI